MVIPHIGNDWDTILQKEFHSKYFQDLMKYVDKQYKYRLCFPPKDSIFNAFRSTPYSKTRVVIIGQDPYANPGQAHGYSFSVLPGQPIPPSLMNVYKELQNELGCYIPDNGCLLPWAEQGVLLLNNVLTVEHKRSNSHKGKGWENFTNIVITKLSRRDDPIIFMLWGNDARKKASLIDVNKHLVLMAAHPSPLAGGAFFGCGHFEIASRYLYETSNCSIDWQIPNLYSKPENR